MGLSIRLLTVLKGSLKLSFEKGADLDVQIQEGNYGYGDDDIPCFVGMTPLMFGVLSKEPSTVKLLLGLGSDADILPLTKFSL